MLEGAGFQIIDLGVNVAPEKFVEVAKNEGVDIVAMSALLTTTMIAMGDVIHALKEAGIREKVKVMIGGAPVTPRYADEIGADGYAPDAASAVEKAKELIGRN
jgi:5-methyltetrahydrofolate--homocysteine methyltransferase